MAGMSHYPDGAGRMLGRIVSEPLGIAAAAALAAAAVAAAAAYCIAHGVGEGRWEPPLVAIGWAVVVLLPWLAAFELLKRTLARRRPRWRTAVLVAGILCGTVVAAGLLGQAYNRGGVAGAADMMIYRSPGAVLVLALALMGQLLVKRRADGGAAAPDTGNPLPLPLDRIVRIMAAGNYVEVHSDTHMSLHRMTMARVAAAIAGSPLRRVSRSTVVNVNQIVRVERNGRTLVHLADGSSHRVGAAFRNAITALGD